VTSENIEQQYIYAIQINISHNHNPYKKKPAPVNKHIWGNKKTNKLKNRL